MHYQPLLQVLMRVHSIEERLSVLKPAGLATGAGSGLREPFSTVVGDASSSGPQISLASPSSKCEVVKREGSQNDTRLDGTSAPRSSAVYLWNFEVEDSLLASLFALANVRQDYDWDPGEC